MFQREVKIIKGNFVVQALNSIKIHKFPLHLSQFFRLRFSDHKLPSVGKNAFKRQFSFLSFFTEYIDQLAVLKHVYLDDRFSQLVIFCKHYLEPRKYISLHFDNRPFIGLPLFGHLTNLSNW